MGVVFIKHCEGHIYQVLANSTLAHSTYQDLAHSKGLVSDYHES